MHQVQELLENQEEGQLDWECEGPIALEGGMCLWSLWQRPVGQSVWEQAWPGQEQQGQESEVICLEACGSAAAAACQKVRREQVCQGPLCLSWKRALEQELLARGLPGLECLWKSMGAFEHASAVVL